jgi:beta-lactamase class A
MILALLFALHLPPVDATVGVAALDLGSGRAVRVHARERFPMGSVYKLPIAIALLHAADRGEVALAREVTIEPRHFAPGWSAIRDGAHGKPVTMTVGQLLEAMVSDSDNTAADVLQHLLGGGPKITAALRALGIGGVRVDRTEKEIAADIGAHGVAAYNADPRDTATPDEMLALLRKLARGREGLRPDSHERLMRLMLASRNPHRISNGLPPGTPLAHKTGTMPGVMNDAGIVDGRIVLVIFTKNGQGDEARANAIAEIARQIYADFTR